MRSATLLGAPLYTALGGATLLYLWREDFPLSGMATSQYSLLTEALIPTIPLFTLAGYFMAESQASKRARKLQSLLLNCDDDFTPDKDLMKLFLDLRASVAAGRAPWPSRDVSKIRHFSFTK